MPPWIMELLRSLDYSGQPQEPAQGQLELDTAGPIRLSMENFTSAHPDIRRAARSDRRYGGHQQLGATSEIVRDAARGMHPEDIAYHGVPTGAWMSFMEQSQRGNTKRLAQRAQAALSKRQPGIWEQMLSETESIKKSGGY